MNFTAYRATAINSSAGGHEELLERKALIEKTFPGRFNILFSDLTFLEIMPLGVDKGHGIRRLGELYDVDPKYIMAIGDSENDLDMLKLPVFPWPWPTPARK